VYVEPGKPAVEKKIGTKLEDLQAEVVGLIEQALDAYEAADTPAE